MAVIAINRLAWIDAMRLLAGLSMVGLHATADSSGQPFPAFEPSERIVPMMLRAVLYIARTELFLMISVFLLLMALQRSGRTYRQTIALQASRLIAPFLFWTVFYAFYNLLKAQPFGYGASALAQLGDPMAWAGFLLLGDVKYHMHFIPTLFGLVLMFPLYRYAQKHPALGLAVLGCLFLKRELDLIVFRQFWGTEVLPYLVRAVKLATYTGYGMLAAALLGLWQRAGAGALRKWTGVLILLGAALFALKLSATWQTIATGRWPYDHAPGYWADFLMPAVLFSLCMAQAGKSWPPLLSSLARYSFGIYLVHPVFLDLAEIALRHAGLTPGAQVVLKICFALPMTILLVLFISRSRPLAWTIGLGPLPQLRRPRTA